MMTALYDELITKYPDTIIRIFFTTEPFNNRKGYHNHFTIYVDDKSKHWMVIEDVKQFFSFDRVDYGIYDPYKAGLFYMSKKGLVTEDWDLLGSDLNKNIKYENKGYQKAV